MMKGIGRRKDVAEREGGDISILNTGLDYRGANITGCGNLKIACQVESDIDIEGDVTICDAGMVRGNIICTNLNVEGSVVGEFINVGQCITVLNGGSVTASLTCVRLNISDTSTFNGTCNMRGGNAANFRLNEPPKIVALERLVSSEQE